MAEQLSSDLDLFNEDEMLLYGFDPNNDADREQWKMTTPPRGTPRAEPYDYSEDLFAFSVPGEFKGKTSS